MPGNDDNFSDEQLLAYLDELLPVSQMTSVESALRGSDSLRRRAAALSRRRDQGVHSVGEIWRRRRISCPTRSQLGSLLLGTIDANLGQYIEFHIQTVGCRYCAANLSDLEEARDSSPDAKTRRRRFFQSSAGYLNKGD